MSDLFSGRPGPAIEPSGAVPRNPFPGIVWGDAEEARFVRAVHAAIEDYPVLATDAPALAQVRQSACWSVELSILQRALLDKANEGLRLVSEDRGTFVNGLRATHGDAFADSVIRLARSPDLRKAYGEFVK